ncbi:MBL fold metallo-hydrolase [Alkalihalobacillus deserti]|uniref:MBL fold metallo-hydrolase n=1 Tax=Alkalihalobacillus deserti TaxID=2879466 RepID=UPI001D1510FA|nr:MBL fold metallo-hydrolase [Alkalihalobacillus deserti]
MKKRYHNLDHIENRVNPLKLVSYFYNRNKGKDLKARIAITQTTGSNKASQGTYYTWIGHSTFLIQIDGLNLLTDPVFSNRMGLEKRLIKPGISLHDLPEIDAVFISHAHYDHLEFSSLKNLKGSPHFFVPVGVKKLFTNRGYLRVSEANWWDSIHYKGLDLYFVPAQHWSRRTIFDKNKSHWGGWVIKDRKITLYFVGDSAYFDGFKKIGSRFDVDVVFMPIGDYEPDWLSGLSHISPEKAVKAFIDLEARRFVPMHYGTYRLSMDTGPEALARLYMEWERQQLPLDQLAVLMVGEMNAF